jgi:AsmA protein
MMPEFRQRVEATQEICVLERTRLRAEGQNRSISAGQADYNRMKGRGTGGTEVRVVKWAGIVLGGLAGLALLGALVLPYVVNLERYRSLLTSRASRALGREVSLGALRISLWTGIGAEAQGIRIAAAPGFGPEPFLTADALRVRLQFLPLLRGQVKLTTAVLDAPHIRLVRNPDRRWSIADLFKPPPPHAAAPRPAAEPEPPRPPRPPLLGGLLLAEVVVRNGEMVLVDQAGSEPLALSLADVDIRLTQSSLADPVRVKADGRLGNDGGRIQATGRITPEADGPNLDLILALREVAAGPLRALLLGPNSAIRLNGRVSGDATISGPVARAALAGQVDLRPLAVQLGGLQKPAGEDGRLAFQAQRADPGVNISRLDLVLKDLRLQASLRIPNLKAPQVVFEATSPLVDLDRLLAPRKPRTAWLGPSEALAAPPPGAQPPAPAAPVQGRLRVADFRYAGLSWRGLDGEIRYRDGVLEIPSAQASFMQGRMAVSGEMDFRPRQPRVRLATRLTGVATEPLVKALANGPWTLQSGLSGESDLSFTGFSRPAVLGSASGAGSINVTDGRLLNYKPLERLAEVLSPILAAQGVQTRLNEFQQLTGHFTVDKGVVRTRDLTLTKPEGVVTAVGSLGLLDSELNFDVSVRLWRTSVEAKVTGTTSHPTVTPKLGRLQQRLERELDKVLPGEQGKGLKDLFKGFFGQ